PRGHGGTSHAGVGRGRRSGAKVLRVVGSVGCGVQGNIRIERCAVRSSGNSWLESLIQQSRSRIRLRGLHGGPPLRRLQRDRCRRAGSQKAVALIRPEEEEFVFDDRTTDRSTKLIEVEG